MIEFFSSMLVCFILTVAFGLGIVLGYLQYHKPMEKNLQIFMMAALFTGVLFVYTLAIKIAFVHYMSTVLFYGSLMFLAAYAIAYLTAEFYLWKVFFKMIKLPEILEV